jgi:hypothetical protein
MVENNLSGLELLLASHRNLETFFQRDEVIEIHTCADPDHLA